MKINKIMSLLLNKKVVSIKNHKTDSHIILTKLQAIVKTHEIFTPDQDSLGVLVYFGTDDDYEYLDLLTHFGFDFIALNVPALLYKDNYPYFVTVKPVYDTPTLD